MKRHQVMDLFHGSRNEPIEGPWNEFDKNHPQGRSEKVRVKLSDDSELSAYYYADKAQGLAQHIQACNPAYFWNCNTKEPLYNVIAWKYLK